MSDYLDANNEELLRDFFTEAEEQVETLESNILVIENDPSNHDAIDEIFRAAHTLKGGSATVEMTELSKFYTMADFFINPTYDDNLPTVNLEARACGCTVITYDTGGCKETLMIEINVSDDEKVNEYNGGG